MRLPPRMPARPIQVEGSDSFFKVVLESRPGF